MVTTVRKILERRKADNATSALLSPFGGDHGFVFPSLSQHPEHGMGLMPTRPFGNARFQLVRLRDHPAERAICHPQKPPLTRRLCLADEQVDDVVPHRLVVRVDRKQLMRTGPVDQPELEDVDARRDEVHLLPRPKHRSILAWIEQIARDIPGLDPPQDLVADDAGTGVHRLHRGVRA
jgi:hypothetical protein